MRADPSEHDPSVTELDALLTGHFVRRRAKVPDRSIISERAPFRLSRGELQHHVCVRGMADSRESGIDEQMKLILRLLEQSWSPE